LKTKWDPNFVFYVTPGINADLMVPKDGRLCKLVGPPAKIEKDMAPLGDNLNIGDHEKPRSSFPMLYQGKGLPPKAGALGKFSGKTSG
jgi:hypothetical protein